MMRHGLFRMVAFAVLLAFGGAALMLPCAPAEAVYYIKKKKQKPPPVQQPPQGIQSQAPAQAAPAALPCSAADRKALDSLNATFGVYSGRNVSSTERRKEPEAHQARLSELLAFLQTPGNVDKIVALQQRCPEGTNTNGR